MNRLETTREIVDEILMTQQDLFERRCGFVHLYGVSATCKLLALKRGLDPEICGIMGMLHDLATYQLGSNKKHDLEGAKLAKEILRQTDLFNNEEISLISQSILLHSNKADIHDPYSELLKDADVLQHYLYNTNFEIKPTKKERLKNVLGELGIQN